MFCFVVVFVVHFVRRHASVEIKGGLWLGGYVVLIIVMARIGDCGGLKWITEPWMSSIVALVAVGVYYAAVANGVWYMRQTGMDQRPHADPRTWEARPKPNGCGVGFSLVRGEPPRLTVMGEQSGRMKQETMHAHTVLVNHGAADGRGHGDHHDGGHQEDH